LSSNPVFARITIAQLISFVLLASKLKKEILLAQPSNTALDHAPEFLPSYMIAFLSSACSMSNEEVKECWKVIQEEVWSFDERVGSFEHCQKSFTKHGRVCGLSSPHHLWPPTMKCITMSCPTAQKLQRVEQREVTLYTLGYGPVTMESFHLKCEVCGINYHHNYFVKDGMRFYYDGKVPDILQLGEHQFVQVGLVKLWIYNMNVAWMSASNCANTYNLLWPDEQSLTAGNARFHGPLTHNHVYDAFTLLSL
ncbi:hypothetical protein K435DRAFT_586176, partial [Dendrothele bispora CBS 962.96]